MHGPPRTSTASASRLWALAALLHLGAVGLLLAAFATIGERSAWVALLLYAPRIVYGLPLFLIVPALARPGRRRLLAIPLVTAVLVAGPLMGLHLHPGLPGGKEPALRLLTYNVWFGYRDVLAIGREVAAARPDIVLFQAAAHAADVVLKGPPFERFHSLHEATYVIASRFPVRVVARGKAASHAEGPAWVRFAVDSPLGELEVLSVHPHSPRYFFQQLRGRGLRRLLPGGAPLDPAGALSHLDDQLREVDQATRGAGPLLIVAGDFNAPEGGALLRERFTGLEDAFAATGNGYGYTFPLGGKAIPFPWLRLDRVLLGRGLQPVEARVAGSLGSDHAPLLVGIARR